MSLAGYVIAAAVMLVLGYLVPSLVRRRQALAESRADDRFSPELRVLTRDGRRDRVPDPSLLPSTSALVRAPLAVLPRGEELTVNRPTGMADRRTAQEARRVAALRAALAARRAEQAAAARRRLVLTLALVAVAAVSWAAVALADFSILLAAFPTAVLVAVVVLGVRAARAERSEWAEVPASLKEPRAARSAGPTYSPSQLRSHLTPAGPSGATVVRTEAVVEDAAEEAATAGSLRWTTEHAILTVDEPVVAEQEAPAAETAEAAPGSWTPVPVPVPTYTLKPVAPRRETAPYAAEDEQQAEVLDTAADAGEQGIDLRAVLARRRAVGA